MVNVLENLHRGNRGRSRARLTSLIAPLLALSMIAAAWTTVFARQQAGQEASPAGEYAEVIAQGVATAGDEDVSWRVARDTVEAAADAAPEAWEPVSHFGFVLADEGVLVVADRDEQRTRLAPGEAAPIHGQDVHFLGSTGQAPAAFYLIELVTAGQAGNEARGDVVLESDPFRAPTGDRDVDLVKGKLPAATTTELPAGAAPTIVVATNGIISVTTAEGESFPLAPGEASLFDGVLAITTAEEAATFVAAVIGAEVPRAGDAFASPEATGSIAMTVANCPAGTTAENVAEMVDSCERAEEGYELSLEREGGPVLTLEDANYDGERGAWVWEGVPFGVYAVLEPVMPEGYSDFVIISPAAQTGGELIAVLAANSEVDVAIYNLPGGTPPPAETTLAGETGTIRLAVYNCPEGMTAGSYDGTACTIATEDFGVTLTDATGADPLTLDDASLEDEVFTWTNVPFEGSPYTVAETRLPAGYVNATVVGAPTDPETGAAVVELSAENSDVGLTFYNFQAAEEGPVDSDGDGLTDEEEVALGTDPLDPADPPAPELVDSDSDGLTDAEELAIGIDPAVFDSDGDGLGDGSEISTHGTSPLLIDTDGDGIDDGTEVNVGTDPLEPASA